MLVGCHPPGSSGPSPRVGAWVGDSSTESVHEYERWAGMSVGASHAYIRDSSWADMKKSLPWVIDTWEGSSLEMVVGAPMLTAEGGSLEAGANGAYDGHWRELAKILVDKGRPNVILRLGYEFNLEWPKWSAKSNPRAYAGYFRRIVNSMRSVSGARFRFDWNPAFGQSIPIESYPGDAFVDFIGLDVYDQSYGPNQANAVDRWENYVERPGSGLRWHRDFAAAHRKPISFPEWAISSAPHVPGATPDNPYFIRKMHDWMEANNTAYALYFDADPRGRYHSLRSGRFPRAAAAFKEAF